MNRRGFFKAFSVLAGAASLSPMLFVPKFEPVHWKKIVRADDWCAVVNPEWIDAPYEMVFDPRSFYGGWKFVAPTISSVAYPIRSLDPEGKQTVPPFIVQKVPKRFRI